MSFQRYESYKDSGVGWLGDLPSGWSVRRIRHLFEIRKRICGAEGHEVLSITQQGIKAKDIESGDGQLSADYSKYQFVEVGDFAMNHMDLLTGYVDISSIFGVTSPDYRVFGVRNREVCFDKYYLYLFQAGYRNKIFYAFGQGSSQLGRWRFPTDEFNSFEFPFPPVEEQQEIAAFLDHETAKIDALIVEQQRLIELLKEKRQSVISRAITKGLNPNAKMKDSGIEWLGEVPQGWAINKLGRAVFMQEGPGLRTWQFTTAGTRVICVTNITESGIDFSRLEKFISIEEYHSAYEHFTVRRGDILLSSSGNSWGKVAIYDGEEEVILNTSTIRLGESDGAPLSRDYIALLLQSDTVREQLGLAMTGACQPNFGPTHLHSVMVAIPERTEQTIIVRYLRAKTSKLDTLTTEARRAIELLQERRRALISAAVTGKIDVRGVRTAQREMDAAE
jgi:type I restriction enzyme S subunit